MTAKVILKKKTTISQIKTQRGQVIIVVVPIPHCHCCCCHRRCCRRHRLCCCRHQWKRHHAPSSSPRFEREPAVPSCVGPATGGGRVTSMRQQQKRQRRWRWHSSGHRQQSTKSGNGSGADDDGNATMAVVMTAAAEATTVLLKLLCLKTQNPMYENMLKYMAPFQSPQYNQEYVMENS